MCACSRLLEDAAPRGQLPAEIRALLDHVGDVVLGQLAERT